MHVIIQEQGLNKDQWGWNQLKCKEKNKEEIDTGMLNKSYSYSSVKYPVYTSSKLLFSKQSNIP